MMQWRIELQASEMASEPLVDADWIGFVLMRLVPPPIVLLLTRLTHGWAQQNYQLRLYGEFDLNSCHPDTQHEYKADSDGV